ncbi:DUF2850 domain-containing protein [Photobacterium makurazakiensis]|uniref:DUF2850 domain-containing protein n=1 Tax=Photobacterium TaxID=657 RepID=UPI003D115D1D
MTKPKKYRQKAFIPPSAIIVGVMSIVMAFSMWAAGKFDIPLFESTSVPDIYGVWTEQDVAPYVADKFELSPAGVFVGGRQVTTQFKWDGNRLEYRAGDDNYSYLFHANRLVRQQPAHYISSFSRQKLDLRSKSEN